MKSSAVSGSRIVQSASLPGSDEPSSGLLRRVSSRALRAAWRAREARDRLLKRSGGASVGFSSRNSASFWLTVCLTMPSTQGLPSLRLRLPLELRSRSLTEMTAASPSAYPHLPRLLSFSLSRPFSRAYLFRSRSARS